MKIEIYDPPMCCPSGLCGPSIDPVLIKMNDAVLALQKQGVEVLRFNLAQQPKEFMANKTDFIGESVKGREDGLSEL